MRVLGELTTLQLLEERIVVQVPKSEIWPEPETENLRPTV